METQIKKIAVITGVGMDARTLTHFLIPKNYHIILTHRRNSSLDIDTLKSSFKEDLDKNPNSSLEFRFMDICDFYSVRNCIENVLKEHGKIDEFYNLAAMSHVMDSFSNPIYSMQCNGTAVFYLLDTLNKLCRTCRFYQASTSEMFGGNVKYSPFDENSPYELRSPYSLAKMVAHNWVSYFRQTHGLFACCGLLFNHSNIYRSKSFFLRKLTNTAARISIGKEKELFLGNINHYRDEHYSDFGCEMMWKMLQRENPDNYVIGNGCCYHGEAYLNEIFGFFNLDWTKYVKFDKSLLRPNEVVKLESKTDKAQKELGWKNNRLSFKDHVGLICKWDYELESGLTPIRPDVFSLYP